MCKDLSALTNVGRWYMCWFLQITSTFFFVCDWNHIFETNLRRCHGCWNMADFLPIYCMLVDVFEILLVGFLIFFFSPIFSFFLLLFFFSIGVGCMYTNGDLHWQSVGPLWCEVWSFYLEDIMSIDCIVTMNVLGSWWITVEIQEGESSNAVFNVKGCQTSRLQITIVKLNRDIFLKLSHLARS